MLNSVKNDMPKSSEQSISKPRNPKSISIIEGVEESYHSSIVTLSPKNAINKKKESIFWGHFDLNLSKSIKESGFSKSSSISMSLDLFSYKKDGLSKEDKESLSNIFSGKDFKELKNSFFSLNGSETSVNNFSKEIDDLFSNISKTLDIDEKLFEGSKKLFKFTALMFSSSFNNNTKKIKNIKNTNTNKNLMTDTLATTAKLYGIMGNVNKMKKKINDAMSLDPNPILKEYLNNINTKYSIQNRNNNDLLSTLNNLSKLANRFNKYLG